MAWTTRPTPWRGPSTSAISPTTWSTKRLAPGVLEELKRVQERGPTGVKKHKLFQRLTQNVGYDAGRGALAAGQESIRATGSALLARAQRAGQAAGDVDISDLLRLVNAIAWASEQVPDDPDLLDRLLALIN